MDEESEDSARRNETLIKQSRGSDYDTLLYSTPAGIPNLQYSETPQLPKQAIPRKLNLNNLTPQSSPFTDLNMGMNSTVNAPNPFANQADETEFDTTNLALKHTLSTESLVSKGSKTFAMHQSPLGSFRSMPYNSTRLDERNGITIVMVIGFAIVIGFVFVFDNIESLLKFCQMKLNEIQLKVFGGKSVGEFYSQEKSMARKCMYSVAGGMYYFLQMLLLALLFAFEVLKRPAPKALVRNVFARYLKD